MRRTAITVAAALCAAFAVPAAAVASVHPAPAAASEGVVRNSAGAVVGGWKTLTLDASSSLGADGPQSIAAATSAEEFPGGGTWHYGTYVDANGYKHCWSFYHHPSVYHTATADMTMYDPRDGTVEYARKVKKAANAGYWANAEPTPARRDLTGTCKVYWGK